MNGQCDSTVSDPYAPTAVISALIRHNWVISPGEQDAHELFHVLLETLEDEMMSADKVTPIPHDTLHDSFLHVFLNFFLSYRMAVYLMCCFSLKDVGKEMTPVFPSHQKEKFLMVKCKSLFGLRSALIF